MSVYIDLGVTGRVQCDEARTERPAGSPIDDPRRESKEKLGMMRGKNYYVYRGHNSPAVTPRREVTIRSDPGHDCYAEKYLAFYQTSHTYFFRIKYNIEI